jgi:hypothetical protein
MKATIIFVGVLFLAASACLDAQTKPEQSCPAILLKYVSTTVMDASLFDKNAPMLDPFGWNLFVRLENTGSIDLTGIKLGVTFLLPDLNEVREAPSNEDYLSSAKVKPGKTHEYRWADGWYISALGYGDRSTARVYLLKATFADGSVWQDDGSHSCSVHTVFTNRRRVPQPETVTP